MTADTAFQEIMARLPPRKAAFVAAYLQHGNGAQAAREAGYSDNENSAKSRAWALLNKDEEVMAAVAHAHITVAEQAVYDATTAMRELQDAMEFAKKTSNATALMRGIELRSRISGVLIDRAEIKTAVIDISNTLEEARARSRPREIEAAIEVPAIVNTPTVDPAADEAAAIEELFR